MKLEKTVLIESKLGFKYLVCIDSYIRYGHTLHWGGYIVDSDNAILCTGEYLSFSFDILKTGENIATGITNRLVSSSFVKDMEIVDITEYPNWFDKLVNMIKGGAKDDVHV